MSNASGERCRVTEEQKFWSKVNTHAEHGCWIWTGTLNSGYGQTTMRGKRRPAHRVAYEALRGPIPDGLTLDHFRMNPGPREAPCSKACVNPYHLEPVTARINTLRGRSASSLNVTKTHCPYGHEYSRSKRTRKNRMRVCGTCEKARHKAYRARLRAAAGGGEK